MVNKKQSFNFQSYMIEHQKQHTDILLLIKEVTDNQGWHHKWLYVLSVGVIVALSVASGIAYFG